MDIDFDDINKSNPALVVAFQKFTTRVHAGENFSFWFDGGNNRGRYDKYIKPGAPKELTLDNSGLMHEFEELAAADNYEGMDAQFVRARGEVRGMLEGKLPEFKASREFDEYVLVKKAGNISKALKLLGLKGANLKTMETLLKAYAVGNDSEKRTALEKMQKIAKKEQLTQVLKTSGLV